MTNLVVNGCSFTESESWADRVNKNLSPQTYYNLAKSGAGNKFICDSTIAFLESSNLDPKDTTVIIMWSGIGRKDLHISGEWYFHLREEYMSLCQRNKSYYYLHSGGLTNSWLENKQTQQTFSPMYKLSDPLSICTENLLFFIQLRSYLRDKKFNFYFTNYFNTWNPTVESTVGGDYCIAHFCGIENLPMYKNFNFEDWFFVDNNKSCLGDFAININQLDNTGHPTKIAHEKFADLVVTPLLLR